MIDIRKEHNCVLFLEYGVAYEFCCFKKKTGFIYCSYNNHEFTDFWSQY